MSESDKPAKRGRPKKPAQKRNEKGELLTKKGKIDKRPAAAKKNLEKSKVYLDVIEAKKLRAEALKKAKEEIPSDSETENDDGDEEEEDEYDIEPVIVKKRSEPQVVEVEKIVEKIIEKEIVKEDPVIKEKCRKLETYNRSLINSFTEYQHCNNMMYQARSIDIKR